MRKNDWKIVLGVALFIGGSLSLFVSKLPDGLMQVAETQGFTGGSQSFFSGLIPDYRFPGMTDERLATSLAGITGALAVFSILALLGKYLYRVESMGKNSFHK